MHSYVGLDVECDALVYFDSGPAQPLDDRPVNHSDGLVSVHYSVARSIYQIDSIHVACDMAVVSDQHIGARSKNSLTTLALRRKSAHIGIKNIQRAPHPDCNAIARARYLA